MHAEHTHDEHGPRTFGLLAEYYEPEELSRAAKQAYDAGYRKLDAYTPYPVHGLAEAIGFHKSYVPFWTLVGGLTGAATGFLMQYWTGAVDFPLNIGGRPYFSWPAYIPITFELGVLFASFSAVISMMALNGLPRPHHPLFNSERFKGVTRNRFFLCIEAEDPKFEIERTRTFLGDTKAVSIEVVEE